MRSLWLDTTLTSDAAGHRGGIDYMASTLGDLVLLRSLLCQKEIKECVRIVYATTCTGTIVRPLETYSYQHPSFVKKQIKECVRIPYASTRAGTLVSTSTL